MSIGIGIYGAELTLADLRELQEEAEAVGLELCYHAYGRQHPVAQITRKDSDIVIFIAHTRHGLSAFLAGYVLAGYKTAK